jgi:ubiquinone/menaquinone biosynthesis C-methylase UbiE
MRSEDMQRDYYAHVATSYDDDLGQAPEHELALYILLGFIDSISAKSLLDVGAGTGRGLRFLMNHRPGLTLRGIEPVDQLRDVAYGKGIPREWLMSGDAYQLPFPDRSFDIVTEFGVLHHVKKPESVIREMLRVARYGVFLSDTNNLGQGQTLGRLVKSLFYWTGLWRALTIIRTRGRGYIYEPNDGLWYYYTLFSHMPLLKSHCYSIHVTNTRRTSTTHWFSASHAVIFATKPEIIKRSAFYTHLNN